MTIDYRLILTRLAESPLTAGLGLLLALQLLLTPSIEKGMRAQPSVRIDQYGIDQHQYRRATRTIHRGETLASIMLEEGVAPERVLEATTAADGVVNLRRIRSGHPLLVYSGVANPEPSVFIYKPSPEKYVTFDLRDSVSVYHGFLPATKIRRTVTAIIQSDLYSSLSEVEMPNAMTAQLVRLFGWRISFQHLQVGDRLAVTYEDHVVDSVSVDVSVVAARIVHRNSNFFAFRHMYEGKEEYFDQDGRGVKGQFLRAPVDFTRISSRYSLRRFHPVQRRYKAHLGTDFAAPTGTPVFSTADGIVTRAAYGRNNGNFVQIRHGETYATAYLHLSRIAAGMSPGTQVSQGQVIGYVGSTGLATGPHVCYRFWMDGVQVDPLQLSFSAVEGLPESELPRFHIARDSLMRALEFSGPSL